MAKRDYSSIFSIKDFAVNKIAPKYLDVEEISLLNVGMFGYMTDIAATTTEDSFNTITTYMNEMFPNKAQLPETIYTYASLFQLDSLFSTPSELTMALLINETDVIRHSANKTTHLEFILDSDLTIDIEGKYFMLDYDITIQSKPYKGDHIYTAFYNLDFNNSLSDVMNPYVRVKRLNYGTDKYLALIVKVRQVQRTETLQNIISNDRINIPTLEFEFEDQLASFEVFYKAPSATKYTQLLKKLNNSSPTTTPFCYYRFKDEGKVELSFSTNERYFQPEFNSEVKIVVYSNMGSEGNFPLYTGNDLSVIPKSELYEYNNNLLMLGIVQSESSQGADMLTLEQLRNIVIEEFSTIKSYTTENDLDNYFTSFRYRYNTEILFTKKRDDVFERVFSAFVMFRDNLDEIIRSNTLSLKIQPSEFDFELAQEGKHVIKAGRVLVYDGASKSDLIPQADFIHNTDLTTINEPFLFSNPFLISVSESPSVVGFYMNSISDSHLMDYTFVNDNSPIQFICNKIFINRNAVNGEDSYVLSLEVLPTIELDTEPLRDTNGVFLNKLRVKVFFESDGIEDSYADFQFVNYDQVTQLYRFEATITTDDYLTSNGKIRLTNVKDVLTDNQIIKYVPMEDCKANIRTFFEYNDTIAINHSYQSLSGLDTAVMTNTYETVDTKLTFSKPLNIVRANATYNDLGNGDYEFYLTSVPVNSAEEIKDNDFFKYFVSSIFQQYNYLQDVVNKVTNNYSIDLKFFNTYGRSRNYVIGDTGDQQLDTINCKVEFKIRPAVGVDDAILVRDVKLFIKEYIESVLNMKGTVTNNLFISNLIKELENTFSQIVYIKFESINDYDSSIQVIWNKTQDFNNLLTEEKKAFVPEFLNIKLEDITVSVLTS